MTLLINSNSPIASASHDPIKVAGRLMASAKKVAETYRRLVNKSQSNGQADEGVFLEEVQNLSKRTAKIERKLSQLEDCTDSKIKAMSREIRDIINGKATSSKTTNKAPQNSAQTNAPKPSSHQPTNKAPQRPIQTTTPKKFSQHEQIWPQLKNR